MNAPEPTTSPSSRLIGLDAARVLATFAIVWVHVAEGQGQEPPWTAIGRFGTSFYVIVAALFVVRGALKSSPRLLSGEIRHRGQRLLKPFLIWSLIYGLFYGWRAVSEGGSLAGLTQWWGPVAGTAVHLWFLPFVFFWGLLAAFATPRLARIPLPLLAVGGALFCAGTYWFCYGWLNMAVSRPWLWSVHLHRLDRWMDEVPPFVTAVWGAILAARCSPAGGEILQRWRRPLIALGLFGFIAVQLVYANQVTAIKAATLTDGRFMANLAAFFLLVGVMASERTALVRALAPWGRYTYVAFLGHMLVIELFRHPIKAAPHYGSLWLSALCSVFAFAMSLGFSRLVATRRSLAFLRA